MSVSELEKEFINDIADEYIGICKCGNKDCKAHKYKIKGKMYPYILDYDPDINAPENILIHVDIPPERAQQLHIMPIRFNGKCLTNMDLATVLKTVII